MSALADGRPVRWGVMGTANIAAAAVMPAIRATDGCEIAAVASRDGERARRFAEDHGVAGAHGSYDALLADDEIDAVYVPLPNALHREWAIRAAEAGKHVLCEKPLALNAAECIEMQAAADRAGVVLMEAFMYRFHPRIEALIRHVAGGAIGEAATIDATFTFRVKNPKNIRLSPDLGGGSLMDVGCYCVNFARTVFGAEPTHASAVTVETPTGVDGRLHGYLEFPGGRVAHLTSSLLDERREYCVVGGTEGHLTVADTFLPGTAPTEIVHFAGRSEVDRLRFDGVDEYQLMVSHFADCVRAGTAPRYTAGDAAATLRAIAALRESAAGAGTPVAVQQENT